MRRVAVDRVIENLVVALVDSVDAVAMMNIEIDNGDSLNLRLLQSVMGSDRDIRKQAKSHPCITNGMVSRGTSENKGGIMGR